MSNETTTPTPQTAREESTIELMNGTADFETTNVVAGTVGELRAALSLTGNIAVNGVIASDSTPIRIGTDESERDEVVHVVTAKKGGIA